MAASNCASPVRRFVCCIYCPFEHSEVRLNAQAKSEGKLSSLSLARARSMRFDDEIFSPRDRTLSLQQPSHLDRSSSHLMRRSSKRLATVVTLTVSFLATGSASSESGECSASAGRGSCTAEASGEDVTKYLTPRENTCWTTKNIPRVSAEELSVEDFYKTYGSRPLIITGLDFGKSKAWDLAYLETMCPGARMPMGKYKKGHWANLDLEGQGAFSMKKFREYMEEGLTPGEPWQERLYGFDFSVMSQCPSLALDFKVTTHPELPKFSPHHTHKIAAQHSHTKRSDGNLLHLAGAAVFLAVPAAAGIPGQCGLVRRKVRMAEFDGRLAVEPIRGCTETAC
jgi:hypothetical protein